MGQRPAVARVRSRYERQWQFLVRRLSPGEVAGLTLTVGIGVVAALGMVFAQLLDNVLDGDGVAVLDWPVVGWLAAHREPWLTTLMQLITHVGSPLGGIGLINLAIKTVVGRDRPPLGVAVAGEGGFSFPSGHATGTTVVWLLAVWMVTGWVIHRWAAQVALWTAAVVVIGAVGWSRVYLGVHYPSDVLASWTLAGAWVTAVALATTTWQARTGNRGCGGRAATGVDEGVVVGV